MAKAYKRLGATAVTANTDTNLYTVPASTETIISRLSICNIGSTDRTYRLAVIDGAIGVVSNEDYLQYDTTIKANSAHHFNIGEAMAATHSILVRANHAEVVFSCSGIEMS